MTAELVAPVVGQVLFRRPPCAVTVVRSSVRTRQRSGSAWARFQTALVLVSNSVHTYISRPPDFLLKKTWETPGYEATLRTNIYIYTGDVATEFTSELSIPHWYIIG